jgi:hypothetical protein
MRTLRSQRQEIPEHVSVFQMCHRVSLLSVDEAREENWITNEEDWSVVADYVPDTIVGVEFYSEA